MLWSLLVVVSLDRLQTGSDDTANQTSIAMRARVSSRTHTSDSMTRSEQVAASRVCEYNHEQRGGVALDSAAAIIASACEMIE